MVDYFMQKKEIIGHKNDIVVIGEQGCFGNGDVHYFALVLTDAHIITDGKFFGKTNGNTADYIGNKIFGNNGDGRRHDAKECEKSF